MSFVIPKKSMTEEDIKLQFITPALTSKWDIKKIAMEAQITDGKINLKGNLVFREKPKRADYLLYLSANNPIAVVEAKDNNHSISHGLQQAMEYARMLDLPFAFSSNGDGFAEHDFLTGQERTFGLEEFPTEEELILRYKQESHLTPAQETALEQPYYTSQTTYPPRYYQRIAINRTMDAIARGQQRLLLVMATGTGKTYTAFQIVYRLLKSGMKRKILYLADRNILVDQSIQQDFAPLEKVIHKINVAKDDRSTITSHEVYFSLYQQLVGDDDKEHFSELFSPDFFDLIIVDEYEIIGLNLKSQLNQGFRGLVLFLLTLKIADKAIHRRQYAQNRNLSAERGAASMCSASTRHTLPTYISFRRSTELSARVDLHRLPLRHSTHVPVARAA